MGERLNTVRFGKQRHGHAIMDRSLIYLGVIALIVGLMVYLLDRPSWQLSIIPDDFSLNNDGPITFGPIGLHLPTFLHAFAFSIISAGILPHSQVGHMIACGTWILIDTCFELFQHPTLYSLIAPNLDSNNFILVEINKFFVNGTFDWLDVASIIAGAGCAYSVLMIIRNKRGNL